MLKDEQFYKESQEKIWQKIESAVKERDAKSVHRLVWAYRQSEIVLKNYQEMRDKTMAEITAKTQDEWRQEHEVMKALLGPVGS